MSLHISMCLHTVTLSPANAKARKTWSLTDNFRAFSFSRFTVTRHLSFLGFDISIETQSQHEENRPFKCKSLLKETHPYDADLWGRWALDVTPASCSFPALPNPGIALMGFLGSTTCKLPHFAQRRLIPAAYESADNTIEGGVARKKRRGAFKLQQLVERVSCIPLAGGDLLPAVVRDIWRVAWCVETSWGIDISTQTLPEWGSHGATVTKQLVVPTEVATGSRMGRGHPPPSSHSPLLLRLLFWGSCLLPELEVGGAEAGPIPGKTGSTSPATFGSRRPWASSPGSAIGQCSLNQHLPSQWRPSEALEPRSKLWWCTQPNVVMAVEPHPTSKERFFQAWKSFRLQKLCPPHQVSSCNFMAQALVSHSPWPKKTESKSPGF